MNNPETETPGAIDSWRNMTLDPPTTELYAVIYIAGGLYRTARWVAITGRWAQISEQAKILYYATIHEA